MVGFQGRLESANLEENIIGEMRFIEMTMDPEFWRQRKRDQRKRFRDRPQVIKAKALYQKHKYLIWWLTFIFTIFGAAAGGLYGGLHNNRGIIESRDKIPTFFTKVLEINHTSWSEELTFVKPEPTSFSFTEYTNISVALAAGLMGFTSDNLTFMKPNDLNTVGSTSPGRKSVFVEQSHALNFSLMLMDIRHMPLLPCGASASLRLSSTGEHPGNTIDLFGAGPIPSVNHMVFRSSNDSCNFTSSSSTSSDVTKDEGNCTISSGCGVSGGPFGDVFNGDGGGLFGLYITAKDLRVFFWDRMHIPRDIQKGHPRSVMSWGKSLLHYRAKKDGCKPSDYYHDMKLSFSVSFCGASNGTEIPWEEPSRCRKTTGFSSCKDFVRHAYGAFEETNWVLNTTKFYNL